MKYKEILDKAREITVERCRACQICDGKACRDRMPGPGAKGTGDAAIRNYDKWKEIRLNMDTIHENVDVDTTLNIFGKNFRYPFFAAPVGSVSYHYGSDLDDVAYNEMLISGCIKGGIAAFTGDGVNMEVIRATCDAIARHDGIAVPTIKPWNYDLCRERIDCCNNSGAFAIAMDIDAAGLPFLKKITPKAGSKTVEELAEIISMTDKPFIIKGIMTVSGALKAKAAGASAIIVSNHGGRVLDQCLATAEVLEDIANALKGSGVKVLVDGGIRTGADIFKALALGADGALICRPFVPVVLGGGEEGVKTYVEKIGAELEDAMIMCGAKDIKSITKEMIFRK